MKLVVSTTSVLPSQWPRGSPIHWRISGGKCGRTPLGPSMGMMRTSWIFSTTIGDVPGALQDLVIVVVETGKHGRTGGGPQDTTLGQTPGSPDRQSHGPGSGTRVLLPLRASAALKVEPCHPEDR